MTTPPVRNPLETYYAVAWVDEGGVYHPDPTTLDRTASGAATKSGMSRYKRKAGGFRVMPFRVEFVPSWVEEGS